MYYDPSYIFVIIGAIIALVAQSKVKSTYSKYSRVFSRTNMTAMEAAQRILDAQGLSDVTISRISGSLTDNYNPSTRVLSLSDTVYDSTSVAAIGVAAHECGHAIQHAKGYAPLKFRNSFVPVAQIGSQLSWPCIMLGLLFGAGQFNFMVQLGIVLFSFAVLFQVVTLPVEYDASSRALRILENNGILYEEETKKAGKVLNAAALTYVAATANAIIQLLRLIYIFGGRDRD